MIVLTYYLCCFFLADVQISYDEFKTIQRPETERDSSALALASSLLYNFCKVGLLFNFFLPTTFRLSYVPGRVRR